MALQIGSINSKSRYESVHWDKETSGLLRISSRPSILHSSTKTENRRMFHLCIESFIIANSNRTLQYLPEPLLASSYVLSALDGTDWRMNKPHWWSSLRVVPGSSAVNPLPQHHQSVLASSDLSPGNHQMHLTPFSVQGTMAKRLSRCVRQLWMTVDVIQSWFSFLRLLCLNIKITKFPIFLISIFKRFTSIAKIVYVKGFMF